MSVFSARIKCQKLSMSTQIRQEKSYCTDFGHGWHNGSKAYSAHICGTACSVYLCRWFALPPVLWCCWLGGRKGIQPVKHLSGEVLAWLSVWGKVQTCIWPSWCHCHSLSLAPAKSRLVATFLVLAHPCSLGQRAVKRVCVFALRDTGTCSVLVEWWRTIWSARCRRAVGQYWPQSVDWMTTSWARVKSSRKNSSVVNGV